MSRAILDLLRAVIWLPLEEAYAVLGCYLALSAAIGKAEPFEAIPYLEFTGPAGSGKTEICVLSASLTDGEIASNISRPALFRWTDTHPGSLLAVDEASHLGRDFDDLLNSGYRRDGKVFRCESQTFTPRPFRTFGPKIIAGIRLRLSPALLSRTIPVEFSEAPMNFVSQRIPDEEGRVRQALVEWAERERETIQEAHARWRADSSGIFKAQRERQVWAPMFAVGETLGFLGLLKTYLDVTRQTRELNRDLRQRERLDAVVECLPSNLEAQGVRGRVPFKVIREQMRVHLDGDQPSDKAISSALLRRGFNRVEARDGVYYAPPRSLWGRLLGR